MTADPSYSHLFSGNGKHLRVIFIDSIIYFQIKTMKKTIIAVFIFFLLACNCLFSQSANEFRTWTSADGKNKIEAMLQRVSNDGKTVTLLKKDGKVISDSIDKLSKKDKEYIGKYHNGEGVISEKTVDSPQTIDFFDAKNQGLIEVDLTARDSLNVQMQVKNLTDEPLIVSKPFAFGAVPVLAQSGYGDDNSQSIGGGIGALFSSDVAAKFIGDSGSEYSIAPKFNIAPKKTVRENLKTVCLEHGKKEPNNRTKFDVRPISEVVEKPEIAILCNQVGTGCLNQAAGQAAVWHMNSEMSWQQLATKTTTPQQGSPFVKPYFNPQQLMVAQNAVGQVVQYVKENNIDFKKEKESGGTTSDGSESN